MICKAVSIVPLYCYLPSASDKLTSLDQQQTYYGTILITGNSLLVYGDHFEEKMGTYLCAF
jgi:hypothetical protein